MYYLSHDLLVQVLNLLVFDLLYELLWKNDTLILLCLFVRLLLVPLLLLLVLLLIQDLLYLVQNTNATTFQG